MARITYQDWKPGGEAQTVIAQAAAICRDYEAQGYDLTLRQLYYQFVARGLIPNRQQSYKRLGSIINQARLAGLLDWSYITDRTRSLESNSHWSDPTSIMRSAAAGFALDKWAEQPTRVEVWVEKEALAGIVGQVAEGLDVAYFACRGYVSQSELWAAGRRHLGYLADGQRVVVLHLGDHDPSGIDMTRDIEDRLRMFVGQDWLNEQMGATDGSLVTTGDIWDDISRRLRDPGPDPLEVRRIALNMDQVEQYDPPPNPAKLTDSRVAGYAAAYGHQSWELDALDPSVLADLISDHVLGEREDDAYADILDQENTHKRLLLDAARRWDEVTDLLDS